jgi:hypothetical protein
MNRRARTTTPEPAPPAPAAPDVPRPTRRPLRVFAFDPSRGRLLGNEMVLPVRYRPLMPGPTESCPDRNRIAVVDYDASRKAYYQPVDLDHPYVLLSSGLAPSQTDPRFHQQMVYAVVSDTIEQFESALGRRIHWHRAERPLNAPRGWKQDDILTLALFPHAMEDANAFYSPDAHGILFGYFQAQREDSGHNLPGQTVFTCLSHDIIVHETTHAVLDGLRGHFMEQTNPDVAAFHEAFADLTALLRHFTHREVLLDAIQRTGGRLYSKALQGDPLADQAHAADLAAGESSLNPLLELASQFGEALGMHEGLRSALQNRKTMKQIRRTSECHERGSILVAAVFDAFFSVYIQRAARHFRIYRAAGGHQTEDLPAPLADALCDEAVRTARQFFRTCARALDYLPPVDVTFGDFLRAVMTAEKDYDPVDEDGIRDAWMQAFRGRAILPDDASFFSVDGLCWPEMGSGIEIAGLPFGGPLGLNYEDRLKTERALVAFIDDADHRELLQLERGVDYTIPSFHPLFRVDRSGSIRWDLVAEVVQTRAHGKSRCLMRGGTTLIISTHGTGAYGRKDAVFLRYAITKPLGGPPGEARAQRQAQFLAEQGFAVADPRALRIDFRLVHGGT